MSALLLRTIMRIILRAFPERVKRILVAPLYRVWYSR